ncbi:MAG: hypothetical protein ACERKV_03045 [Clostridiaceae bacterium]
MGNTDKRAVTNIIENLDKYKEILTFIYDKELYHKDFDFNKLSDEQYYTLYTKLVETLDFEIFKLIKNN